MRRNPSSSLLFILSAMLTAFLNGCVSAAYYGESFPPTESLAILSDTPQVRRNYRIIGNGNASGEFSAFSNQDLQQKLIQLGREHGAEAMIISGTRIVPEGRIASSAQENFILATDDPDQVQTENAFDEDISADPGRPGTVYKRIMFAEFLRKN